MVESTCPEDVGRRNGHRPCGYEETLGWAKQLGVPIGSLLALSASCDPFYIGSPAQVEQAEWFAEVAKRHHVTVLTKKHLRRLHYLLESEQARKPDGNTYKLTRNDWEYLNNASKYARILGLVPYDAIEDRRSEQPIFNATIEWFDHWQPAPAEDIQLNFEPGAYDLVIEDCDDLPDPPLYSPHPIVSGYLDAWSPTRPCLIIVCIEKSTQDDILKPLCQELKLDYYPGTGYETITMIRTKMMPRIRQATERGAMVRVLYISDYDDSGKNMPIQTARHIEHAIHKDLPNADVRVKALALTEAQVREYGLTDKVAEDKIDEKGKKTWELDALEALRPGTLAKLIREHVATYRAPKDRAPLYEAQKEAQQDVNLQWWEWVADEDARLDEINARLCDILETQRPAYEQLKEKHQQEESKLATDTIEKQRQIEQRYREERGKIEKKIDRLREMLARRQRQWDETHEECDREIAELERQAKRDQDELDDEYEESLQPLRDDIAQQLAPLEWEVECVRQAFEERLTNFEPEVPPIPDEPVNPLETPDWLFDSTREPLDQLKCYELASPAKKTKNRLDSAIVDGMRRCKACGENKPIGEYRMRKRAATGESRPEPTCAACRCATRNSTRTRQRDANRAAEGRVKYQKRNKEG